MNSGQCQWNEFPSEVFTGSGVYRFGIATVEPVSDRAVEDYRQFVASGRHGSMQYLERYNDIRSNPALLLEGAKSIICCAIPYFVPFEPRSSDTVRIARYALADDYHEVVRDLLETAAAGIRQRFLGAQTRVCVDTAPIRERYWAERCGLGRIGLNNQLLIPDAGSYFFLGEILTTVAFQPTDPIDEEICLHCGKCVATCPTGALKPDGTCDATHCLSYLTIEHRGQLPEGTELHGQLYGCDKCAEACPLNNNPPTATNERFYPRAYLLSLTLDDVMKLDQPSFSRLMRRSPIKRAKLDGLQRNAKALKASKNRNERGFC